jgi:hypothetical protein
MLVSASEGRPPGLVEVVRLIDHEGVVARSCCLNRLNQKNLFPVVPELLVRVLWKCNLPGALAEHVGQLLKGGNRQSGNFREILGQVVGQKRIETEVEGLLLAFASSVARRWASTVFPVPAPPWTRAYRLARST